MSPRGEPEPVPPSPFRSVEKIAFVLVSPPIWGTLMVKGGFVWAVQIWLKRKPPLVSRTTPAEKLWRMSKAFGPKYALFNTSRLLHDPASNSPRPTPHVSLLLP